MTPTSKARQKHKAHTRTQENVAGRYFLAFGLDRAQMSNIEAGKGNSTLATIEKIAQTLGVSSDELLK